jgi:D-3-phosphoglycerate dehydrogenase
MVADQVRDYLESGNIKNSVNFPEVSMPRNGGYRMAVVNANVPNMLGQISTVLAESGLNIVDMLNKSRGNLAYTLVDVEDEVSPDCVARVRAIEGVLSVRMLNNPRS